MTPEQLKMARAMTKMGVRDLAKAADVAPATITRLETGKGGINMRSSDALRAVLETQGVQFLDTGDVARGPGVAVSNAERSEE
tara:strand:- start:512 stop:760 length:249 start_codon:yes stop_codon:yes gene_type:complete